MGKKRNVRTMVVGSEGSFRFQTGMVTAALIARGLSMARAFEESSLLRDRMRDRETITTTELEEAIDEVARTVLGHEPDRAERWDNTEARGLPVDSPVSTERLLRFALTAGLTPEEALHLSRDVDDALSGEEHGDLSELEAEDLVGDVLGRWFGDRAARRWKLITSIRRSDRPLILLIGGATGTGKSTLATDLAFRLGIAHVTSTDMLREAMRAVLPREVVPGLHDHSFRGMVLGRRALSDPRERVLAGFRQQADQVGVAVRAAIRRAAREGTPLVIEGTHLRPPFHRYAPADADVAIAGVVLAVPEERRHKRRFPRRAASQPRRRAEDYLESFQAVRWIQDDLLAGAEAHDELVIANQKLGEAVDQLVDALSHSLELRHPIAPPELGPLEPSTLFIILDGLPDRPTPALDGATPLAAAKTPTLNRLAAVGGQGVMQTGTGRGELPETDEGLMSLLAGPVEGGVAPGRGMLEALGLGLDPPRDSVVLRGNLATRRDGGELVDRRAGRIRSGTADLLAGLRDVALSDGLRGSIRPAHEHRVVVMVAGPGLSSSITDTDPGSQALEQNVRRAVATDGSPEAERTAAALEELLAIAAKQLGAHPHNQERSQRGMPPANCIITRGAAMASSRPTPRLSPEHAAMVAACSTAQGVARAVGLQPIRVWGATANLDTDLDAKLEAAVKLLDGRGLVVVHIKGTDIAAHDRRPLEKRDFVERFDQALGRVLRDHPEQSEGLRIVVASDHGTDSNTGDHLPDPVPILIAQWSASLTAQADFDEESATSGALGLLEPGELQDLLWGDEPI